MKKMTFALACASAVAAFAWEAPVLNAIGFDDYTLTDGPFTGLSNKKDNGTDASAPGDSFWLYVAASGSTDGSTVKAYDSENTGKPNYLELSTEGGTLWRSINGLSSATTLGKAQEVPADGLYIDTMVQFTPTEDGGDPDLDPSDKLAIWLRVTTDAEDATKSVTNLCVRGCAMTTEGTGRNETPVATPTTFVLTGAEVKAGTWHRLKVRAIGNIVNQGQVEGDFVSGFVVEIDRKTMRIANDGVSCDSKFTGYYESALVDGAAKLITDGQFIPSLMGYQNEDKSALQAVGFKGSGAIDSLQFTTQDPGGEDPAPVKVELSISAENATVTGIENGEVEVGSNLTFTVTAAEGYNLTGVTINGKTVTADAGNYTYTVADTDEAVAVVVTTEAIPSIDWNNPKAESGTATEMFGITGALATADGQKLAAWAQNVGKVSFDKASEIKTDAFLLNCANTDDAINTAKANFKIVSIEQNDQGAWVAKVTGDVGDGGEFGNGYVEIKGSATVDAAKYELETTDPTARFFKAFLVLEAPAAK